MNTDVLLNRLQRWAVLSSDDINFVRMLPGEQLHLHRGDDPFARHDPSIFTLLILDGWAAEYREIASGRRVIVELYLPSDFRTRDPHCNPLLRTTMLSSGTALLVNSEIMLELMTRPVLRRAIEWTMRVRASVGTEWLVNIGARKAFARLAHLLCELRVRLNSAGLWTERGGDMPLTQADLASALAMSNVHLNIAMQRLRAANLVDLSGRRLTILDRSQLEAIAEFNDDYLLRWPTDLPDRRVATPRPAANDRRKRVSWSTR
jgi:CRP-like cAMP-binding protein